MDFNVSGLPTLTSREIEAFSLHRALRSRLNREVCLEYEFDHAAREALPASRHGDTTIWMPVEALLGRALSTTPGSGGDLVATTFLPPALPRRPRSALLSLGATMQVARLPVQLPKVSSGASVTFVAESPGVDHEDSELQTGVTVFEAHTATATVPVSRILHAQTGVEELLRRDFLQALAMGWDRVGISGAGDDVEPEGLLLNASVPTIDGGGAAPTLAQLAEAERRVTSHCGDGLELGWLLSPVMREYLRQAPRGASSLESGSLWESVPTAGPGGLLGYRSIASPHVRAYGDASPPVKQRLAFGLWSELVVLLAPVVEVLVDPYTKKKEGLLELTLFAYLDVQVRDENAFVLIEDSLASAGE